MAKSRILILSDKKIAIPKINNSNYEIDIILKDFDDKTLMNKMKTKYKEYYDYILFIEKCPYINEFMHYLPVNYIEKNNNHLYISEINVNPVLVNNIELVVDRQEVQYVAILIKYILKNNIDEKDFHFVNILKDIKKINNISNKDFKNYKEKLGKIVKRHYSQNNVIRCIKYKINKNEIIKKFMYKNLENIKRNLKKESIEVEEIFNQLKDNIIMQ